MSSINEAGTAAAAAPPDFWHPLRALFVREAKAISPTA
jgi:hypothetical protein